MSIFDFKFIVDMHACLWVYKCTSFPSNCMPRSTIITSFHSGVSLIAICSSCVLSLSSLQGQIRPCSSTSILSHYFFEVHGIHLGLLLFGRGHSYWRGPPLLETPVAAEAEEVPVALQASSSSGVFVIKHVHCHASHFGNFWIWTSFWNRFLTLASFKTILKRNTSLL